MATPMICGPVDRELVLPMPISSATTVAIPSMFSPEKPLTPEEEELGRKKARLTELEAQLADRELELASCLADLNHFEMRYLQTVGRRYALLDELKAKIAEARARQNQIGRASCRERGYGCGGG